MPDLFSDEHFRVCSPGSNLGSLLKTIREVSISEVDGMIDRHYLHSRPAVSVLCLMLLINEKPAGMCIFALPPRETAQRYGGLTWELARLYLKDEVPKNTESWFIAKSVRWVARHHKDVRYLVSYSDPSVGHTGTIYRASGWIQDGATDEGRITPRCDYEDDRGNHYSRRSHVPPGASVTRTPRVSKLRFYLEL